MAFSSCFCFSPIPLKIDRSGQAIRSRHIARKHQKFFFSVKGNRTELFGQQVARMGSDLHSYWSFLGGSRIIIHPKLTNFLIYRKASGVRATWLASSQLASSVFTLGTAAVLPFYTLMVVAPKAELTLLLLLLGLSFHFLLLAIIFPLSVTMLFLQLSEILSRGLTGSSLQTKKSMESSIPYVVLGLLYAILLYLSWTPDTIRLMFASKYWLPELPGIAKMFSGEMTLASAWIHLLAVDLFAARQVFHDGLQNEVETRHSVSLCLLFCPIGIVTHVITKALTKSSESTGGHGK